MTDPHAPLEIVLWRHAEAEDGLDDLARALTAKGHRQAERMGRWLDALLPPDARVLVSPALRAQQTVQGLGRAFETVPEIAPGAAPEAILAVAAVGGANATGCVLLVGHQPTLGQAAARLLTGQAGHMELKKGSVTWLRRAPGNASFHLKVAMTPALLK